MVPPHGAGMVQGTPDMMVLEASSHGLVMPTLGCKALRAKILSSLPSSLLLPHVAGARRELGL